jgi:uncharacterized damage-inducible protein DinB
LRRQARNLAQNAGVQIDDIPGKSASEMFISMLHDGTREWRQELGRVPRRHISWQPYQNGCSIGALILHMIDVEVYWIETVAAGRKADAEEERLFLSKETQQYMGKWPTPHDWPLSKYYELQDRIRSRTVQTIRGFKNLSTEVFLPGGKTGFTLRWILHHVVTHESYHGGQAVLLKELARRQESG